jgi:DNA topoisomerase IB
MSINPPSFTVEHRYFEFAGVISNIQLEALLKVLMAACSVAYNNGETNKELTQLAKENVAVAHKAALAVGSEAVQQLVKVIQGKAPDQDELKSAIADLRKSIGPQVKSDREISEVSVEMLKAATQYLMNYSVAALNKVRKLAPLLNEPVITQNFISDVASQQDFKKPLQNMVKKITGRSGIVLTSEEKDALKAANPEVYAKYAEYRHGHENVWRDEWRNFVFKSGKETVPYSAILKYFAEKKIDCPKQKTFVGMVDANQGLYTTANKKLNMGFPGPLFRIVMNPKYDSKKDDQYVFTTMNAAGKTSQYCYTEDWNFRQTQTKFEKVADLSKKISRVRTKWLQQLNKQDLTDDCVIATVIELIHMFSARVGSRGNSTGGQATVGMATLKVGNLKIGGGKAVISYHGKDGVSQRHILIQGQNRVTKIIYNQLEKLIEGKTKNDPLFTCITNSGNTVPVNGRMVNREFDKFGSGVTIHKLRHLKGTEMMQEMIDAQEDAIFNRKVPFTQKEANDKLIKMATKVGEQLGHVKNAGMQQVPTGITAIENYIDPNLMDNYYKRLNLRTPVKILRLLKKG